MLVLDADGFPWLDVAFVMEAGTFFPGDADAVFIQVETLSAGAAIHRQEVRSATLLHCAQWSASQLTSLMLVREDLRCWAAPCVFFCFVQSVRINGVMINLRKGRCSSNSRNHPSTLPQHDDRSPYHTHSLSSLSGTLPLMHKPEHRTRRLHTGSPHSSHSYSWRKYISAEDSKHF